MLVRVDDIKESGLSLQFNEGVSEFPALLEMAEESEVDFPAPLQAAVRMIRVGEMIEVEGHVETTVRLSCGRCLARFENPLSVSFAVAFAREMPTISDEDDEEVELSAEELGLIPFEGEEIDLRPLLQEQVIMALPVRSLCREECKGLCPQCGTDLNEKDCGCVRPVFASKFTALKNFKVESKDQKNKR